MSTLRTDVAFLNRFFEDGYVVIRDVLAPETVKRVHDFLTGDTDRALDRLADQLKIHGRDELIDRINMVVGTPDFDTLDKFARDLMTGHYPLEVRLSEELWAIPRDSGLRKVLTVLLNSDRLYMHMPPTARFVLPNNRQAGVPAHADTIYNEHMSGFITVWIPFVEITDECGGVAVYPGSGHNGQTATKSEGKFWFDAAPTEGIEKLHILCKPGDILIMSNHIIHESMPNVSHHTRVSTDLRFFGESGWSKKHYLDMQDWHIVVPTGQ